MQLLLISDYNARQSPFVKWAAKPAVVSADKKQFRKAHRAISKIAYEPFDSIWGFAWNTLCNEIRFERYVVAAKLDQKVQSFVWLALKCYGSKQGLNARVWTVELQIHRLGLAQGVIILV